MILPVFLALFGTLWAAVVTSLAGAALWGLNLRLGDAWARRNARDVALGLLTLSLLLAVIAGAWTGAITLWVSVFA